MARKHHGWKTGTPELRDLLLYAEDIYGVHSIEYQPVPEERTLYIFASMGNPVAFDSFRKTRETAERLEIPLAPLVHQGVFKRREDLGNFLSEYMEQSSSAWDCGEILPDQLFYPSPATHVMMQFYPNHNPGEPTRIRTPEKE